MGLKNLSEKTVIAVKLGWRLFYEESHETILMSGESPLLGVTLKIKERREVEFPLVSFAKISKSLLKNGRVDGNFKIDVAVTDILFEDNEEKISKLSSGSRPSATFLSPATGYSSKGAIVMVTNRPTTLKFDGCQNQQCQDNSSGTCFECKSNTGTTCSVQSCNSCTSGRCDEQ